MKAKEEIFKSHRYFSALVIVLTLIIVIFLGLVTYYINYWPTDSENPYLPTAARLSQLPYLSYMHYLPETQMLKLTMRAKETLIVGIALMQQLLNDTQSLYPNILLLIIAHGISCLLFYSIFRKIFDQTIGCVAFILFSMCVWPYIYILQGAHPPLVLMNFLIAIFIIQQAKSYRRLYFLSGIFLGLMLFSSPTSPLYLPYYLGMFLYNQQLLEKNKKNIRILTLKIFFILVGMLCIFLIFTAPNPVFSFKEYLHFLKFSQTGNNFVIYRDYLAQFLVLPENLRGSGWLWIIKYSLLIMPILFLVYVAGIIYLTVKSFKKPVLFFTVALSLSTPLLVEASQVAQFGRNYFSWIVGIIFLICFSLNDIKNKIKPLHKNIFVVIILMILSFHTVFNVYAFFNDILPSRLVTTNIYQWLIKHKTNEVSTYNDHPRYKNMIEFLNNPKFENKIYFWPIQTIKNVNKGYILIPTITGKTIWCECREDDFAKDPYLTQLFNSGEFEKYVVARFKTLSSSKYWTQEEEICTYRDLIIGDIKDSDRAKGMAWILDAQKLQQDWFSKNTLKK